MANKRAGSKAKARAKTRRKLRKILNATFGFFRGTGKATARHGYGAGVGRSDVKGDR